MRIATSTIYQQQTSQIDNTQSQYSQIANQLSSGLQLQQPSDDPVQIGEDLSFNAQIELGNQTKSNLSDAQNRLNQTDSSLATLTAVLQSARSLAVQGASDSLTSTQRQSIGTQIDQLLSETINLANTQYNGVYVFGGTAANATAPVTAASNPNSGIAFSGNYQSTGQIFINGKPIQTSVTITQAFNYSSNAANPGFNYNDGTPDVFTTLRNLRDTLNHAQVVDESAAPVNRAGYNIGLNTTLGLASFAHQLTPDPSNNYSIQISGSNALGSTSVQTFTFTGLTTVGGVAAAINLASAATGVSAVFDAKQERLILTGSNGPFTISDVPTPPGTTSANFTTVFGLTNQGDVVGNVSRQIGDVDHLLQVALQARANVGAALQVIAQNDSRNSQAINDNTQVKSRIEDVDVAKASTQFTATQALLQATYQTTTQLEKYKLFDYIS